MRKTKEKTAADAKRRAAGASGQPKKVSNKKTPGKGQSRGKDATFMREQYEQEQAQVEEEEEEQIVEYEDGLRGDGFFRDERTKQRSAGLKMWRFKNMFNEQGVSTGTGVCLDMSGMIPDGGNRTYQFWSRPYKVINMHATIVPKVNLDLRDPTVQDVIDSITILVCSHQILSKNLFNIIFGLEYNLHLNFTNLRVFMLFIFILLTFHNSIHFLTFFKIMFKIIFNTPKKVEYNFDFDFEISIFKLKILFKPFQRVEIIFKP